MVGSGYCAHDLDRAGGVPGRGKGRRSHSVGSVPTACANSVGAGPPSCECEGRVRPRPAVGTTVLLRKVHAAKRPLQHPFRPKSFGSCVRSSALRTGFLDSTFDDCWRRLRPTATFSAAPGGCPKGRRAERLPHNAARSHHAGDDHFPSPCQLKSIVPEPHTRHGTTLILRVCFGLRVLFLANGEPIALPRAAADIRGERVA
jgi:hypothetical protein